MTLLKDVRVPPLAGKRSQKEIRFLSGTADANPPLQKKRWLFYFLRLPQIR